MSSHSPDRFDTEHRETLSKLIHGGLKPRQAIYVAAKLRLADKLQKGPQRGSDLAVAVGAHAASLHRLLRGLVAQGLLFEDADGRFGLTPVGHFLRSGVSGSLRGEAIVHAELDQAWFGLLHSVRSGEIAFNHAFGAGIFEHFVRDTDADEYFHRWMASSVADIVAEVIRAYPFPRKGTVVDVGGGHASLLIALLQQQPGLRGILADVPQVVAGARREITDAGLLKRCEVETHDFFESVPAEGDIYILQRIIHDWNDGHAMRILLNCRNAMKRSARLLLIEKIMPERVVDAPGVAFLDLNMLVETGGAQRTEEQYRRLLDSCGFCLVRVAATRLDTSVIEAAPA